MAWSFNKRPVVLFLARLGYHVGILSLRQAAEIVGHWSYDPEWMTIMRDALKGGS